METLQLLEQMLIEKREALKAANIEMSAARTAVANARDSLAASDYKRHKNAEYSAVGLELPYSWEEIHKESQALRDIINEKEPEIPVLREKISVLKSEVKAAQEAYWARVKLLKKPLEGIENTTDETPVEEASEKESEVWAFETAGN